MPNIDIQGKSVSLELAFNLPPKRAVEYLQAKGVTINFDWETASDEARARAFTAAGVYRLDILSDLKELVTQAVEKGTPYNEFKTQMLSALASKGYVAKDQGLAPYRLKNIYRQNIQTAYQAGSYKDLDESKKYLPYWKYIAIDDARTTTVCRSLNKTILPADDPFWDKNFPPNHYGCRSNVMGMTKEQAMKEGVTSPDRRNEIMEDSPPAKGFDYNPGKAASWDELGKLNTCDEDSAFAEKGKCAKIAAGQKTWVDHKRQDINKISKEFFLDAPQLLTAGKSKEDALQIAKSAIGFPNKSTLEIQSPIEKIILTDNDLLHVVEDRKSLRERFAGFIRPTLENPYEIYFTKYDDGSYRKHYIGLFQGYKNFFIVIRINRDGSLMTTAFPMHGDSRINKKRIGDLVYCK